MKIASIPPDEKKRIEALLSYDILDTEFEEAYNELTEMAAYICKTPIALITLIDSDRQWFKAKVGIEARETSRDIAFCTHAILQDEVLIVPDTLQDERFADNPLVIDNPSIRFYAGAPLITSDGFALGTLCAIDRIPQNLDESQLKALKTLAKQVISQLELRLSYKRLQKYSTELHELNANKNKFFSIISHDLRAPFTGILGLANILNSEFNNLSTSEIKEIITGLHTSAHSSFNLVENLLQWSAFETNKISWQPCPIKVDILVSTVISVLSAVASRKSIQILTEPNLECIVNADINMLHSILQNLISNALKFTPSKGLIRITSLVKDNIVEISVSDTGIGIKSEQIQKLFRIETSYTTKGTDGESGTGLGLLLCKQFVEKNGGTLWVESKVGSGTKFTFTLPRAI